MIRLTRLNNHPLVLNSDLIKFIEAAPDTVITLVTGEKVVVLESTDEVMREIVDFRRELLKPLGVAREESPGLSPVAMDPEEIAGDAGGG